MNAISGGRLWFTGQQLGRKEAVGGHLKQISEREPKTGESDGVDFHSHVNKVIKSVYGFRLKL